jgi:hypothetical protein
MEVEGIGRFFTGINFQSPISSIFQATVASTIVFLYASGFDADLQTHFMVRGCFLW